MMQKQTNRWLVLLAGSVLALGTAAYGAAGQTGAPPDPEAPRAPEAPPAPKPAAAQAHVIMFGDQPWLGVVIAEVSSDEVAELGLREPAGALVQKVVDDSPAAKAGLEENDVIVTFAGERVRSAAQLKRLVRETPAGRTVEVEIVRDGQQRTLSVELAERHAGFRGKLRVPRIELPHVEVGPLPELRVWTTRPRLGITGTELSAQLADYFGVEQGEGVLVTEVLSGSAAAKAGLKAGDVIVAVDGDQVSDLRELRHELAGKKENNQVTLTIVRDRREQRVTVELEERRPPSPRRTAEVDLRIDTERWERFAREMEVRANQVAQEIEQRVESQEWQRRFNELEEQMQRQQEQFERELEPRLKELERELERQMEELEKEIRELEAV